MAELVRVGEMDIPAGRMVPAVDQGRASFAFFFIVQKVVPLAQPPEPCPRDRSRNHGADCLGGRYGRQFAAIRAFVSAARPGYQIPASQFTRIDPGNRDRDQPC